MPWLRSCERRKRSGCCSPRRGRWISLRTPSEKQPASHRTDVRTIDARAAAAGKVAGEYWADYLPSLTGIFQPFYQNPPTLTTPRSGWRAQLVLTFPFYDGGFRYGVQREALASESQLALEASLRQVQSEVRASFEALRRADAALAAAQSSATLAQEALALANQAYAAGATTNLGRVRVFVSGVPERSAQYPFVTSSMRGLALLPVGSKTWRRWESYGESDMPL